MSNPSHRAPDDRAPRTTPTARGDDHRRRSSAVAGELEMWGGLECTVNRVNDTYLDQLERNGHATRDDDLPRFASLGIRTIRYPVLWERTAPNGLASADWSWADARVPALRALGITPILGLVHHGSGPRHTNLLDPGFADGLAEFAGAVAERFPWVEHWTPVNEPLTTARFSALYGIWHPHLKDDRAFVAAVLNECRGTVLAMRAIRRVNPGAKLIQTDDLGKTWGIAELASTVEFYNQRRWLSWDLLCGKVGPEHPLWDYLVRAGASEADLRWFAENPCPPDVIGINYYVTSERWLDRPGECEGRPAGERDGVGFIDVEAVRAVATPPLGIGRLLDECWQRYGLPIAITEAHLDARREDQMRWLLEIWRAAEQAREAGIDVRAVTAWALLGSFDWNCLVGACRGYYEPGPFDLRAPLPRPTGLARLIRELATGQPPRHPVLQGEGWWRRPDRFVCKPVRVETVVTPLAMYRHPVPADQRTPILVSGANGTLGQAFARLCVQRNLAFRVLDRAAMDIADPASVMAAIARHQPWAIVNTSGYVRIDDAEAEADRCFRENTTGPRVLAECCADAGIALVTFSSDQVFDGRKATPYVESDTPAPLNVYGRSKAEAEAAVLARHPGALVVRTSAFFGPWDGHNFLVHALTALADGKAFAAADDVRVAPTYVPDLVNTCLDLLVDGESGIVHLVNVGDMSWAELARAAAQRADVDTRSLRPCANAQLALAAPRPRYSVLASERVSLMPALDDALARFAAEFVANRERLAAAHARRG
ncbi:family 1 glycosylhydrolase [Piscinibacter koreensis]|uniref:dTDP-4-dehydrorhamnose reductase n=1 Tax=Piscinibacter koreensis TaxID=2742824 RepID=A0A7Y6NJ62_9BURK|nr:family 1 glycosylhydrolase [Schlegelella koreensis]NUZ04156.1 sugar nucleotide-binding protein [Schlegelella koreensis]